MPEFRLPKHLADWAETSLASGRNVLATSNQGTVLLFRDAGVEFVVKVAMGEGAVLRARRATLRREARAYERMDGLRGVPSFYGLLDDRFLVLEHLDGTPYRDTGIADRDTWFARLLEVIRGFHERGVAHGDLKSKSNLMVARSGGPRVIDFGTTVLHKPGFHPINNRLFAYAKQLDLNAWVKHKYEGRYEDASEADRSLLRYSRLERWLRGRRQRKDAASRRKPSSIDTPGS